MRLSVVIPAYNVQASVYRTLASLDHQSCPVYEVLVVDDGSVDGTQDEVARAKSELRLPRIRVLRQENQGVSAARNAGLECVAGDYVLFLDADDVVAPNLVESILSDSASWEGIPPDVVRWQFVDVDDSGEQLGSFRRYWIGRTSEWCSGAELLEMILRKRSDFVWMGSAIYGTQFLRQNTLSFTRGCVIAEDSEFIWKAISAANRVRFLDKCLTTYVRHDGSVSGRVDVRRLDAVMAHWRVAEYLRAHYQGSRYELADSVVDRIIPIFFREVQAVLRADPRSIEEVSAEIESRNPGTVSLIQALIESQIEKSGAPPPLWRLFHRFPWLSLRIWRWNDRLRNMR